MSKETTVEKVKIVATQVFRDKFDNKVRYTPGTELEVDAERAEDLVTRELATYAEPIG